jgi:predicted dehydrogenase
MLRGAVIGTGFWANFQIPAWQEIEGVAITALYNRTISKAEIVGNKFGIPNIYNNMEALLEKEKPDFVDIITDVDTHAAFTQLAAQNKTNVICQKPMASSLQQAKEMLQVCKANNVRLFIHENFRFQLPIRKLKAALDSGIIGRPFKARVYFCSAFPVFDNQPFLKELDHFILTDVGSHVLDVCRFLFGEVKSLSCLTQRVNQTIKGEDVANVLMQMQSGLHCYAEMSYASVMEKEAFPQTLVFIEGEQGSLHLTNDFELKIITQGNIISTVIQPVTYSWADPAYAVVHSSIVDCNRNILKGLQGGQAETTGEDNLNTVQLVWASYEAAATGKTIHF